MARRAFSAPLCAALVLSAWPVEAARAGGRRHTLAPAPAVASLPAAPTPSVLPSDAVMEAVLKPIAAAALKSVGTAAIAAPAVADAPSASAAQPARRKLAAAAARLAEPRAREGVRAADAADAAARELDVLYAGARPRPAYESEAPVIVPDQPAYGPVLARRGARHAAAAARTLAAGLVAAAPWAALSELPARSGVEPIAWLGLAAAAAGGWAGQGLARRWERALRPDASALPGLGAASAAAAGLALGAAALALGFWSLPAAAAAVTGVALAAAAGAGLLRAPSLASPNVPLVRFSWNGSATLMSVSPETLGRLMTLSGTLERGLGENDFYTRRSEGFDRLVYLRRAGDFIELVARNSKFRAAPGSSLERATREAVPDSVLSRSRVRRVDTWTGAAVVDADELFAGDLFDMAPDLGPLYEGRYELDGDASAVTYAKSYPGNAELRSRLVFKRVEVSEEFRPQTHLADARRLELVMRYSLAALPEGTGFVPRPADERVGAFDLEHQDLTDPEDAGADRNIVTRWKLEKKDPSAAVSPVKEPIVYWIDPSVPVRYRVAARRAAEEWNKAFARIGLLNAIEVRDAPADGSFDPFDARYNVISFFLERGTGYAIGPSRVNPLTGQIFNAGIAVSVYHVRQALGLAFTDLDETDLDDLDMPAPGKGRAPRRAHRYRAGCRHADGAGREAAMTLDVLAARGNITPEEKERFIEDYLTEVLLHEMGHTLGLRHNFLAKEWRKTEELSEAHPLAASVMDYLPVNLAAPGAAQGRYWNTAIGPYDYLAIEYLYKPLEHLPPAERDAELKRIAARMDALGLSYATDEDLVGMDPASRHWILGRDALAFIRGRLAVVRELWASLEARRAAGDDGRALYRAWVNGWKAYYRMSRAAAAFVGGVRFRRKAESGMASYEAVSAEEQFAALSLLYQEVFRDEPFAVSPALAAAMAPARLSTVNRAYPDLFYVPYDDLTLLLREGVLDHLLDAGTLERLAESARLAGPRGAPPSVEDMLQALGASIWAEVFQPFKPTRKRPTRAISSARRKLQEAHLNRLMALAFPADGEELPHLTFTARAHLKRLQALLRRVAGSRFWDAPSRDHLKQAYLHLGRAFKDYTP